jgi:hypothetical protein
MTKNPSWKLPEVFVLIVPKVIRTQTRIREWEPRRGVRILIIIIPQMIRECQWKARRRVKILKDIASPKDRLVSVYIRGHVYNHNINIVNVEIQTLK